MTKHAEDIAFIHVGINHTYRTNIITHVRIRKALKVLSLWFSGTNIPQVETPWFFKCHSNVFLVVTDHLSLFARFATSTTSLPPTIFQKSTHPKEVLIANSMPRGPVHWPSGSIVVSTSAPTPVAANQCVLESWSSGQSASNRLGGPNWVQSE